MKHMIIRFFLFFLLSCYPAAQAEESIEVPFRCSEYIENIKPELKYDVDASCAAWVQVGIISWADLKTWLEENTVVFSDIPYYLDSNLFGYFRTYYLYYEMCVIDVLPLIDIDIPSTLERRTAFHETGHMVLTAAGIPLGGRQQHDLLDEYRLCPEACPAGMVY